jgi:hypothetical protein
MALALYSSGHVKDRMAFCFMVFDDDGNNSLDRVTWQCWRFNTAIRFIRLILLPRRRRCWSSFAQRPALCSSLAICPQFRRVRLSNVSAMICSQSTVWMGRKKVRKFRIFCFTGDQPLNPSFECASQHSAALMDKFNRVAAQLKVHVVALVGFLQDGLASRFKPCYVAPGGGSGRS